MKVHGYDLATVTLQDLLAMKETPGMAEEEFHKICECANEIQKKLKVLKSYSDPELINELKRRGYEITKKF